MKVLSVPRATTRPATRGKMLRERTLDALRLEIAFIPAAQFQSIDLTDAVARAKSFTLAADSSGDPVGPASGRHMTRLCAEPLLDKETERDLFCLMNFLKFRANSIRAGLSTSRPSRKKLEKIDELLQLAIRLRNRIVRANVRLAVSLVKKYYHDPNAFDELLSEAIGCLMKAVEKFDFSRGYRFSTYATRAITRDVFRSAQRRHRDMTRFVSGGAQLVFDSCEEPSSRRDEATWSHLDRSIATMLNRLDARERFIVRARYGFDKAEGKPTFSNIGRVLGVSKERVRQLEFRAIQKLREAAAEFDLEETT